MRIFKTIIVHQRFTEMEIRPIRYKEIPLTGDLPPPEWQIDLSAVYGFHFGEPYFHAVVAIADGVIAGTGMAILNGDAAWLGTIIVREAFRRQGLGSQITRNLIGWSEKNGSRKIILVASDMGKPVYEKLGFRQSMYYLVYEGGKTLPASPKSPVRKMTEKDLDEVYSMDKIASGEDRSAILKKTWKTGFTCVAGTAIAGYYLPDFGRGLIIATGETAGSELLAFRFERDKRNIVIPESNTAAKEFLEANSFSESRKFPRMYLDSEVSWRQDMIFCRGSGYLG